MGGVRETTGSGVTSLCFRVEIVVRSFPAGWILANWQSVDATRTGAGVGAPDGLQVRSSTCPRYRSQCDSSNRGIPGGDGWEGTGKET